MIINLIIVTLIVNIITIILLKNSKLHDRYLLFLYIIGQIILICGELFHNNLMIRLGHLFFTLGIIIGSFYFIEKYNLYFILFLIFLRFGSYVIYDKCIFNIWANDYLTNLEYITNIHNYINWHYIYITILVILLYRINYVSN
jgi:hypothetical protein